jgi:hypothetical protein
MTLVQSLRSTALLSAAVLLCSGLLATDASAVKIVIMSPGLACRGTIMPALNGAPGPCEVDFVCNGSYAGRYTNESGYSVYYGICQDDVTRCNTYISTNAPGTGIPVVPVCGP